MIIKKIYYSRITDELLRYGRIRQFIFQPKSFISFQKIGYNLKNDEIILLDTLLIGGVDSMGETDGSSKGYFNELIPIYDNPYLQQKKTVENAYPDKMEFHPIKKFVWGKKKDKELTLKSKCWSQSKVPGNEWSKLLPTPPYTSIRFKQTYACLWEFIMEIINDFTGKKNDLLTIKQTLIRKYQKIDIKHVRVILACQGKRKLVTSIERGTDIDSLIINQDYYISNLDLFLLAQHYKIPFVLIGGKPLYEKFQY